MKDKKVVIKYEFTDGGNAGDYNYDFPGVNKKSPDEISGAERLAAMELEHRLANAEKQIAHRDAQLKIALEALEEIAYTPLERAQYSVKDARWTASEALEAIKKGTTK